MGIRMVRHGILREAVSRLTAIYTGLAAAQGQKEVKSTKQFVLNRSFKKERLCSDSCMLVPVQKTANRDVYWFTIHQTYGYFPKT